MLCYCHFTWNEFNPQLFFSCQILQNFVVYVLFEWEILICFSLLLTILALSSSAQFYCFLYWSLRQPGLKVMMWGSCPECHSGYCRASPKLLGSWAQVLGGRPYPFFLASPGMQILISHCPREQLVQACLLTPCLSRNTLDTGTEYGFGLLLWMGYF